MSYRVEVSEAARHDLARIHRALAVEAGRGHAEAFVARLVERGDVLAAAPDRGKRIDLPLASIEVRSILIAPHRVYYEVTDDAVVIVAVLHPGRRLASLLDEARAGRRGADTTG